MKIPLKAMIVFTLAGLSGTLLLYTSQAVQHQQKSLRHAQQELQKKSEELDILRAEWAFLSAPERLQKIAEDRLGFDFSNQFEVKGAMPAQPKGGLHDANYDGAQP